MKRRVKTDNLRQLGVTLAKCLNQFDLARQMVRVARANAMEIPNSSCVTNSGAVCCMPCTTRWPTAWTDSKGRGRDGHF